MTGDPKASLAALTRSFELTPSGQLDALKVEATECKDFRAFASDAGFTEVLKTQSKVKESKCSMGPACGKCPRRAKCAGESGENQETTP